jgi:hypothetical protein
MRPSPRQADFARVLVVDDDRATAETRRACWRCRARAAEFDHFFIKPPDGFAL